MTDLKPCPFCGGEAHTYKTIAERYCAICNKPFCASVGPFDTEAEAIAAWNTRAERTCSVVCIIDGLIMDEPNSIELSCGHTFETWDEVPPNYCPNCGAKVVGE